MEKERERLMSIYIERDKETGREREREKHCGPTRLPASKRKATFMIVNKNSSFEISYFRY